MSSFTEPSTREKTRLLACLTLKTILAGPNQSAESALHALEPREAGASPALPRNCERGRNLREATGRTAGKGQGVGRSVSQET